MLSIDVGSKKVCVIEGSCRSGVVTVSAWGETEYASEIVVNGVISDRTSITFLISEIIKKNKFKSKKAVITISNSDIISRELKLPDMKLQNLTMLVKNEMLRIIGADNSNYTVDFLINGTNPDKMLNIMAYAIPNDTVEGYYTLLKDLKLVPVALDIHPNSISKLLSGTTINNNDHSEENIIVADIGYSKIYFHGFVNGVYHFSRAEISPVPEFVREIFAINRTEENTDSLKELDFSLDAIQQNTIIADTCRHFISRLSDEILRYIQYVKINTTSKSVSKIYITGGIVQAKNADAVLSNVLNMPVETLHTSGKVNIPETCSLAKTANAAGALIRL